MIDSRMDVNGANRHYSDFYPVERTELQLVNKSLFDEFNENETEMVITKSGRRMYPYLVIKALNLDPNADYCIFVEMELHTRCRFKYNSSVGWSPAGHEESQSPHRFYLHPESPSKGSHWMSQDISFVRLKLTNTCSPPSGQIVLTSMHKYQPKILIVKTSRPEELGWAPMKSFVFSETSFIAVTAYQNEKIKGLKINYNPFAKGFRENGKSYTKRKQMGIDDPESPGSCSTETSTTPPPQPEPRDYPQDYSDRTVFSRQPPVMPVYYHPSHPYYGYHWWGGFNSMNYQNPWAWMGNYPCRSEDLGRIRRIEREHRQEEIYKKEEICEAEDEIDVGLETEVRGTERKPGIKTEREIEKPSKVTNFSIDAILRSR